MRGMRPRNLRVAVTAAHSRWPELRSVKVVSSDHADPRLEEANLQLWGAELFLALACARGHTCAIAILEREYLAATERVIARVNRTRYFVDEARQILRDRLLVGDKPRIGQYAAAGPLTAWVRVAALRVALNLQKSERASWGSFLASVEPMDPAVSPDTFCYREEIQAALCVAIATLSAQEKDILRLHYFHRQSIDRIGARHGAHRATVARWLAATRRKVFELVSETVCGKHGVSETEFRGIVLEECPGLELSPAWLLEGAELGQAAARGYSGSVDS
jgi:RNA polymerase sigma-70 factor, ECF subfamily